MRFLCSISALKNRSGDTRALGTPEKPSITFSVKQPQQKAGIRGRQPLTTKPRGCKPFVGEAERSGKRGYCAASNEALPVQQRLETLHKVCALAFAFSTAHIQRAPLHSAQCFKAHSASLRTSLHSAQHYTAPSKALHPAQRAKTRPIAASEPSRLQKGGLLRFLCSINAHENRSADTRARTFRQTRHPSKAKPGHAAQRAPLLTKGFGTRALYESHRS